MTNPPSFHHFASGKVLRLFICLLFFLLYTNAILQAQSVTYDTTFNGWNARVTVRANMDVSTDSVQGIIFIPGTGECGTDRSKLLIYGPHYWMTKGWDGSVQLADGKHYPVIISLQPPSTYQRPSAMKKCLDAILNRYRIKRKSLHLTGISQGGWMVNQMATYKPTANDYTYYDMINSIVNVQGVVPDDVYDASLSYPQKMGSWAKHGGRELWFEQALDARNMEKGAKNMNDSVAGAATYIKTNFGNGGHNNFEKYYDPSRTDWVSINAEISTVIGTSIEKGMNIYQWMLSKGNAETSGNTTSPPTTDLDPVQPPPTTDPPPVAVSIGKDTTLPLKQSSATDIVLTGKTAGIVTSLLWTQIAGPTVSIVSPSLLSTTIKGLKEGNYSFRLLVNGLTSSTINLKVVDYQKKGECPCRQGSPKIWTLNPTSSTQIYYPYLRQSGFDIQGGDTIKIPRNPQNGGIYTQIELGDFGGSKGCPVVVVPKDQVVTISGVGSRFFLGSRDSNFVAYAKIDGTVLRSKGIMYGFQHDNDNIRTPDENTTGIAGSLISNVEIAGFSFRNVGVGVFIKIFSDSTRPWKVYDNFIMKNIKIHDNYLNRINGEGMYLGTTDASGTLQAGNDGPPNRMDSLEIYNNILDSLAWDGIQTSNSRYTLIHDNVITRAGTLNKGSQNIAMFLGGNVTGSMYNNVIYNAAEGIKTFGYGNTSIYNNYVDSTDNAEASSDAIYADQKNNYLLENNPALVMNIYRNITNRSSRAGIYIPNNERTMAPGQIYDNDLIHPTKTVNQMVVSNAGDSKSNNRVYSSFPVTIKNLTTPAGGPLVEVTKGSEKKTFTNAADIIDWLRQRLTGQLSNQPPVASAGQDQTITLPADSIILNGSGVDEDGTITTYSWSRISGPTQFSFVNASTSQTKVKNLVQGVYKFELKVTDNKGATATDTVSVTVNAAVPPPTNPPPPPPPPPPPANRPPVANAGSDITITLPTNSVSLSAVGSNDPDGTISLYSWSKISGPSQYTILSPDAVSTEVTNLQEGTYRFVLMVVDDKSLSDKDTVVVVVNPAPNQKPVANAGTDITVTLPSNGISLNGTDSYDPDGTISAYSWTKISGPSPFTILNSNTATPYLPDLSEGTYVFELKVTDNKGATATDLVIVTVNPAPVTPPPPTNPPPTNPPPTDPPPPLANHPPVANAGEDQVIVLPFTMAYLDGSGSSDKDGTIQSYEWKEKSGPSDAVISFSNAAKTSITGLVEGEYIFELTIKDDKDAITTAQVKIKVVNNTYRNIEEIKFYPMPAIDILNFRYQSDDNEDLQLSIYDSRGEVLIARQCRKDQPVLTQSFDVKQFSNGIYYFSVKSTNKHIVKKIVINH